MHIKTIIYDAAGFYISPLLWNDANYAFRQSRAAWHWIGSPGWYCTEENKAIYEALAAQTDMEHWCEGEYSEVDITLALLTTS